MICALELRAFEEEAKIRIAKEQAEREMKKQQAMEKIIANTIEFCDIIITEDLIKNAKATGCARVSYRIGVREDDFRHEVFGLLQKGVTYANGEQSEYLYHTPFSLEILKNYLEKYCLKAETKHTYFRTYGIGLQNGLELTISATPCKVVD